MSDERPDALLKSALEKIIYFEARSEQLQNDLAGARAEAGRLRSEVAAAAQREIDLRRQLAEREVQVEHARRERDELARVMGALKTERAALLGKLIEASRIHGADQDGEVGLDFDLASFISELRSEVMAQRSPAAESPPASIPIPTQPPAARPAEPWVVEPAPSAVARHAQRLAGEGRLQVTEQQLLELSRQAVPAGRAEESLFSFSLRELASPDATSRGRSAARLKALGNGAAAPALAAALHAETEPSVQVQLLSAFATLAGSEGIQVVSPHLSAPSPEVRIAALKALLTLEPAQAAPHLSAAMKDPDRSVRRRASLLALGLAGDGALRLGEQAIGDDDPEVRALGARALGAAGGEQARALLLQALRDGELKVRQAAAESLSRILGQDVSGVVRLEDAQRRREIRRLASLEVRPPAPRASPGPSALRPAAALAHAPARPARATAVVTTAAATTTAATTAATTTVAVVPPAPPPRAPVAEALCQAVMAEIRCSIRGRTLEDLASAHPHGVGELERACALLAARGQVIRRGHKYFAA